MFLVANFVVTGRVEFIERITVFSQEVDSLGDRVSGVEVGSLMAVADEVVLEGAFRFLLRLDDVDFHDLRGRCTFVFSRLDGHLWLELGRDGKPSFALFVGNQGAWFLLLRWYSRGEDIRLWLFFRLASFDL